MIRIFIMKINAEFALFTWSCLKLDLIEVCLRTCDMNSALGSVVPLAMFHQKVPSGILCARKSVDYLKYNLITLKPRLLPSVVHPTA